MRNLRNAESEYDELNAVKVSRKNPSPSELQEPPNDVSYHFVLLVKGFCLISFDLGPGRQLVIGRCTETKRKVDSRRLEPKGDAAKEYGRDETVSR